MPKPLKRRELIEKLREHGFEGPYAGAKHQFMVKGGLKLRIPNPHRGDISEPLLREILRQAEIDPKTWSGHHR
ncbi:MAG: type II toxin-antitoxin system HicA family toxin [Elusimicrobia bacterium]|nr:type II toxin-antitoxin system HicA family toxin [Elusimicrobiota bacterium]